MAGSDCSSATRSGANGARGLTYGSGAWSGASETNPTCVPVPFRAGADTMSVSGERSTAAPPSAGSALRRDTVPRASLITTARASPVQPTIAGRRSKLSASGRTAPLTGETSSARDVGAYVAGASETVTATQRPSGDHAGPPSAAGVATSGRVLPVATSTTDTSARTQSSPAGEGECEKAIAAPSGDQSNAGPLIPAPTCPPTCTSCAVRSRAACWPAPPTAYRYTDVRHSLGSASMSGSDTSTAAQRPSGEIATLPTRLTANASSGVHRATGPCAPAATRRTSKHRAGTPKARLPGEWWCGCRGAAPERAPARRSTGGPGGGRRNWLGGIDG